MSSGVIRPGFPEQANLKRSFCEFILKVRRIFASILKVQIPEKSDATASVPRKQCFLFTLSQTRFAFHVAPGTFRSSAIACEFMRAEHTGRFYDQLAFRISCLRALWFQLPCARGLLNSNPKQPSYLLHFHQNALRSFFLEFSMPGAHVSILHRDRITADGGSSPAWHGFNCADRSQ